MIEIKTIENWLRKIVGCFINNLVKLRS